MYQQFNITALHQNSYGNTQSRLTRMNNAIVEKLNAEAKLPKYIIFIVDTEIIEMAGIYDFGIRDLLKDCLIWLSDNIVSNIETRIQDIKSKRPGVIFADDEPKMIWVGAVARPTIQARKEDVFSLITKFNKMIMDMVATRDKHFYANLETITDMSCFDMLGRLKPKGKELFWKELDYLLRKFDTNSETSTMNKSEVGKRDHEVNTQNWQYRQNQDSDVQNKTYHRHQNNYQQFNRTRTYHSVEHPRDCNNRF